MIKFDPLSHRFQSQRNIVLSAGGMVATSHPLAAQIGANVLRRGGNAVDAAIATAVALTITEPTSNGIGGDCFAIVWHGGRLYGLNSSGPAPVSLSLEELEKRGLEEIPPVGWIPVTVPGEPAGWAALSERFGKLPFADLFDEPISLAESGVPVFPTVGVLWKEAYNFYSKLCRGEEIFAPWFESFVPNGSPPKIGSLWFPSFYADTFRRIGESKASDFYCGELANKILSYSDKTGGYFTGEDLTGFKPEWVEPVSVRYKGYDIWELPPNGQGLTALIALGILRKDTQASLFDPQTAHLQIEAMKLAFSDALEYISDPYFMEIDYKAFLDDAYLSSHRRLIGENASLPRPGRPLKGGTVYVAAADREGTMVSYIQSNYMGFGSGLVIPGTGITLQNRGCCFSVNPAHPNAMAGGKRPYHTIIPGFITQSGKPVGPFGVMGGFMQPQGHLQVVMNMIDFNCNPQEALDAPRWQWVEGKKVLVEKDFDRKILQGLLDRGHQIEVATEYESFGRGQIIMCDESGMLWGGTEKRCDGYIALG
ncbi:MAG: gamma-glutamyltransferase [Spirochaetes bacterium]|nr:MAG: gamma-glutamyltransferase [Spirochaetota bacterium]